MELSKATKDKLCTKECIEEVLEYKEHFEEMSQEKANLKCEIKMLRDLEKKFTDKIEALVDEKGKLIRENLELKKKCDDYQENLTEAKIELETALQKIEKLHTATEVINKAEKAIASYSKTGLGYSSVPPPINYVPMPEQILENQREKLKTEGKSQHETEKNDFIKKEQSNKTVENASEQISKKKRKHKNKKNSGKQQKEIAEKQQNQKTHKVSEIEKQENVQNREKQITQNYNKKCFICGRTNHLSKVCYYNFRNSDYRQNNHSEWNYQKQWDYYDNIHEKHWNYGHEYYNGPGVYYNDYHQNHRFYNDDYFQRPRNYQRHNFQNNEFSRDYFHRNDFQGKFWNKQQSFSNDHNYFPNENVNSPKPEPKQVWLPKRKSEDAIILDYREMLANDFTGSSKSKETWLPTC